MLVSSNFTFSYLKNSAWKIFANRLENSTMDGIKIQSKTNGSYYLQYRTRNEGKTDFYSFVTSRNNDYAGMTGRPVQLLQIQAYGNNGQKMTTRIVVMYRVSVQGRWLPWVSNAEPAWMESVFKKYRLDGTINTSSYYAGNIGQNIDGLEIRVYDEASIIDGGFTGGEAQPSLSYMVNDLSNWNSFTRGAMASKMDGIKIQTSTSKNYYLEYKTWNEGKTDYYSAVKSTGTAYNDYAGYPGRPIQLLSIQAYDSSGERLRSGIVVMYRVHVDNRWLPWVSNADPQWMRDAKTKYSLDGTLDTASTYAGNKGQNINGVEVRIFEDDSFNPGLDDFSGSEIKLATSYMADSLSNWNTFSKEVRSTNIDGIKIQTSSSNSFVLRYKSWNAGNSGYYSEVSSLGTAYNDYAGYPGKRMQRLSVQAYDHSGNRIREGVVIMYRVRINGRALPWVSNANPEWMRSVQRQYNLGGTLDYVSTYAGNSGQNIDGVEIRAFEGSTNDHPLGNLSGTEASVSLSYMRNSLSNWTSFNKTVLTSPIEGIKIQTSTSKGYYLSYKSHNQGNSDYYPIVKSTGTAYNDYAGYMNKPIQLLSIQAYRNDGTRLRTGIVVMYRVHVDNRWLPWVSNANPEWMRSVQLKYNLGGTLDTTSTYAGNRGQNINGVEIRVFEENDTNGKDPTPSGKYKIINVPFIPQNPKYPTGCESVAAVMALRHIGNSMPVDTFIDNHLNRQSLPNFDPDVGFGGNPRSTAGWGCWSPVIKKSLRKIFSETRNVVLDLKGKSLSYLCTEYIDKGTPVILWATQGMRPPYTNRSWYVGSKKVTWISPMHCLLLVGYDDNNYIFNDPQDTKALTYYSKESVEAAYAGLNKQALAIQHGYVRPEIPKVPSDAVQMTTLIPKIRELEDAYVEYYKTPELPILSGKEVIQNVLGYLRSTEYDDPEWVLTAGFVDQAYITYVKQNKKTLHNFLDTYIKKDGRKDATDGSTGIIDFCHMAGTMAAYFDGFIVPSFWASWGGDLATGMRDTTTNIEKHSGSGGKYEGMPPQAIADATIGNPNLSCNYSDFCSDFDAYKVQARIYEMSKTSPLNFHLLSEALTWYYDKTAKRYDSRFKWLAEELNCSLTVDSLYNAVYKWMTGAAETSKPFGLLYKKGGDPSVSVREMCCNSFVNYIITMTK